MKETKNVMGSRRRDELLEKAASLWNKGEFRKCKTPAELAVKAYKLGHPRVPTEKAEKEALNLWESGQFDSISTEGVVERAFLFDRRTRQQSLKPGFKRYKVQGRKVKREEVESSKKNYKRDEK